MEKFVVIEIGSTNTKAYLYNNGNIKDIAYKTIEFKNHYKINKKIDNKDKEELFNLISSIKENNIFVFGTSIFRNLNEEQKSNWLKEFKDRTGINFNIVTSDMENEYTVCGAIANTNYTGNIAIMIGGGGSTELSIVNNGKIIEKAKINQ